MQTRQRSGFSAAALLFTVLPFIIFQEGGVLPGVATIKGERLCGVRVFPALGVSGAPVPRVGDWRAILGGVSGQLHAEYAKVGRRHWRVRRRRQRYRDDGARLRGLDDACRLQVESPHLESALRRAARRFLGPLDGLGCAPGVWGRAPSLQRSQTGRCGAVVVECRRHFPTGSTVPSSHSRAVA